jgi:hypothetical protein
LPEAVLRATPFQFLAVAQLTRIGNDVVETLHDLHRGLSRCSDSSLFFHFVQSPRTRRVMSDGCGNDIGHWVLDSVHCPELAEQLGAVDLRDYDAVADLRADVRRLVGDYCVAHQRIAHQPATERFWFCEQAEVASWSGITATSLATWLEGVERTSRASFAFHFVSSRLRLGLRTNDFSAWFDHQLGMPDLAARLHHIDVSAQPIASARNEVLRIVAAAGARA